MRTRIGVRTVILLCGIAILAGLRQYSLAQEEDPLEQKDLFFGTETRKGTGFHFINVTEHDAKEPDFELGPGMEVVKIGRANIIVPKGTKVENKGSWIKVEDLGDYLGRSFDAMDNRLKKLEATQEEIVKSLEKLSSSIEELRSQALVSKTKR
jgi:hypothetical protein